MAVYACGLGGLAGAEGFARLTTRRNDMADVERILIVGGGIAGLSLATALHNQGYTAELVERSAAWPAVRAGINLPANGVRVLRTLGLEEAVDRNAAVLRRWGFFDQQGELLCETDLEKPRDINSVQLAGYSSEIMRALKGYVTEEVAE
jgi:2-polyprenyl-6-methoxyphenol hydroxylase-like FAD-dependent oxidoreductase